jgi:predicted kinase
VGKDNTQLVVLMGLPGSGKSYFSSLLAKKGFSVISGESVACELFGVEKLSSDQHAEVYKLVRLRALGSLKSGIKVVIDGTNLRYEYRRQIYNECAGFLTKLVYLEVDKKTALGRIKKRLTQGEGSGCDEKTFVDFKKQLELPREDEPVIDPELLLQD